MGGFTELKMERIMKRKTFVKIVTFIGAGLTVFLFVVAGLVNWGATFASDSVTSQLEAQEITMPAATGNADEAARALGLSETGAMVGSSNSSSKSDVLEPDEM